MLFYVEDSDTRFFRIAPGKITSHSLDAIIDTVALNRMDIFVTDVCLQRANFPSLVRESYCDLVPSEQYERIDNNVITNVKLLAEQGIDSNEYLLRKAREKNIKGWIAVRMNDMHAGEEDNSPLHTEFWRKHPEFHISDVPYENSLDFSHPEVRKYVLDFIREVVNRYDIDGIMLDLMRFPTYFRPREAWLKHELLTEIQREAAKMVREKAQRTGRKIEIAVRVPLEPFMACQIGFDVVTWVQEKLTDQVIISGFVNSQSYEAPVEEWKKIVNVPVTVSLEGWHRPHSAARAIGMDEASLNGAAYAALQRGADRIMVYNMMELNSKAQEYAEDISDMPDSYCDCPDAERNCLVNLDDAEALKKRPRRYFLAWQDMDMTIAEQDRISRLHDKPALPFELPCTLAPGEAHTFNFFTGELDKVSLVPEFDEVLKDALAFAIKYEAGHVEVKCTNQSSQCVVVEKAAILALPEKQ